VPGRVAAEQVGEERGRVGPRVAQPGELRLGGEQGDGTAVGEHRVAFDRHGPLAEEPGAADLEQEAEHAGRLDRLGHPVRGPGRARPDLDAHVGAVQPRERPLVGHAVADHQRGARRHLGAQLVDGRALVGGEDGELHHLLAIGDRHLGPGGGTRAERVEDPRGDLRFGRSHVHGHARGFRLQPYPCLVLGDLADRGLQPRADLDQLGRQALDEPDVELGPVAAHEVYLGGESGEGGEVAQGPAGDHRDRGLRQRGQSADGGDGLGQRHRLGGIEHDRRQRAVVVAGDQQVGHSRDPADRPPQVGVDLAERALVKVKDHDSMLPRSPDSCSGSGSGRLGHPEFVEE
jgi:hypothetical protein